MKKTKTFFFAPFLSLISLILSLLFLSMIGGEKVNAVSCCIGHCDTMILCGYYDHDTNALVNTGACVECGGGLSEICLPREGQPCTSSPNSCGDVGNGHYTCNGTCDAVIPPATCGTTCTKNAGNVLGELYGQDDGTFYLEPQAAAQVDSLFCKDFGVTVNNNYTLSGYGFSPDYGDVNFGGSTLVVGNEAIALHGSLAFANPGFSLSLPPIPVTSNDTNNCVRVNSNKTTPAQEFNMLQGGYLPEGICLNPINGEFAGWIKHPTLGYMNFDSMNTSWRPSIPPTVVTLNATPSSIIWGESVKLNWTITGALSCTASATDISTENPDGSFSGDIAPASGSRDVVPLRTGSVTYAITCMTGYNAGTVIGKTIVSIAPQSSCTMTGLSRGKVNAWVQNCGPTFAGYLDYYKITPAARDQLPQHLLLMKSLQDKNISDMVTALNLPTTVINEKSPRPIGNIADDLKVKFTDYICSLEEMGVTGPGVISAMHLDVLGVTDPDCSFPVTLPRVTMTNFVPQEDPSYIIVSGYVESNGGATVTEKGVVYSKGTDPADMSANTIRIPVTSVGESFSTIVPSLIEGAPGLTENTDYYFWVYAKNSVGTRYSSMQPYSYSNSTNSLPSVIIPAALAPVGQTTATLYGQLVSAGTPATPLSYGVEYFDFTAGAPYTVHQAPKYAIDPRSSIFYSQLTGLVSGHTYYYRAYATNPTGTAYSENIGTTVDDSGNPLPHTGKYVPFTTTQTNRYFRCAPLSGMCVSTTSQLGTTCNSKFDCGGRIDPITHCTTTTGDSCNTHDPNSVCYDDVISGCSSDCPNPISVHCGFGWPTQTDTQNLR